MRIAGKRITSPRVDALLMVLVGWTIMDAGGVILNTNEILGWAMWVASIACFVIAWLCWRSKPVD